MNILFAFIELESKSFTGTIIPVNLANKLINDLYLNHFVR